MNTLMNMTIENIYLDWVNNFITAEGMANHYGVKLSVFEPFLKSVINLHRKIYG